MVYQQAIGVLLKNHSDSKVLCVMELEDKFILSIQPNNMKSGTYILDGYFTVNKSNGKIGEYCPTMDPDEFRKAIDNIVYKDT